MREEERAKVPGDHLRQQFLHLKFITSLVFTSLAPKFGSEVGIGKKSSRIFWFQRNRNNLTCSITLQRKEQTKKQPSTSLIF